MRLVQKAQQRMQQVISASAAVVDATEGNGHDTVFLAQAVGEAGRVFGFDVQSRAIEQARVRLQSHGLLSRVSLFQCSHETMADRINVHWHGQISAVMFNLGYLPGSDKTVVTRGDTSTKAIRVAATLLKPGGAMSIVAYPGHAGGAEELHQVMLCLDQLHQNGWSVEEFIPAADKTSPRLLFLQKR